MGFYESFQDVTDEARSGNGLSMSIVGQTRGNEHALEDLTREFVEDEAEADRTFDRLISEASSDAPEGVFANAGVMTLVINNVLAAASANVVPGAPQKVITRLQKAIAQLHKLLTAIKAGSAAISFTITVGFPLGISIGMTF